MRYLEGVQALFEYVFTLCLFWLACFGSFFWVVFLSWSFVGCFYFLDSGVIVFTRG